MAWEEATVFQGKADNGAHLEKRAVPQPGTQEHGGLAVQPSKRATDVHAFHVHAAVLENKEEEASRTAEWVGGFLRGRSFGVFGGGRW